MAATKVASLDCTDPSLAAEYNTVVAKMKMCETASGISLVLPMKNAKKVILCEKCPELLDYKLSKQAPLCNVTISNGEEIRLQAELNRLGRRLGELNGLDSNSYDDLCGSDHHGFENENACDNILADNPRSLERDESNCSQ
uniref:Uncharacterized protein n=1 Tax=Globisporangium ultimum (strain ATCC 200006 / CBS 805.95 / DAOM BR144) TaxID=431595 RepID=K3WN87_GLOUD